MLGCAKLIQYCPFTNENIKNNVTNTFFSNIAYFLSWAMGELNDLILFLVTLTKYCSHGSDQFGHFLADEKAYPPD